VTSQRRTRYFYGGDYGDVDSLLRGETPALHPITLLNFSAFLQVFLLEYDVCYVTDGSYGSVTIDKNGSPVTDWDLPDDVLGSYARFPATVGELLVEAKAKAMPTSVFWGSDEKSHRSALRVVKKRYGVTEEGLQELGSIYDRASLGSEGVPTRPEDDAMLQYEPGNEAMLLYRAAYYGHLFSDCISQRNALLTIPEYYPALQYVREEYSLPQRLYREMEAVYKHQINTIISASEPKRFYIPPLVAIVLDRCKGDAKRLPMVILDLYDEYRKLRSQTYEAELKMAVETDLPSQIAALSEYDSAIESMRQQLRFGRGAESTVKRFWHYLSEGMNLPKKIIDELIEWDNDRLRLSPANEYIRMYNQATAFKNNRYWNLLQSAFRRLDIPAFERFDKISRRMDKVAQSVHF
jgi:hypothetical protein